MAQLTEQEMLLIITLLEQLVPEAVQAVKSAIASHGSDADADTVLASAKARFNLIAQTAAEELAKDGVAPTSDTPPSPPQPTSSEPPSGT